ncbi:MAG: hydrogen gas-evolving membrane-bound hydrogenase subunit E [Puniceicoccaceae bacterium]
MKVLSAIALFALVALLIYGSTGMPAQGDPEAPAHQYETPAGTPVAAQYYIKYAYRDTHTPNIVTAVLADYRAYDTMGEVIVIAVAGLVCFLLLRKPEDHA